MLLKLFVAIALLCTLAACGRDGERGPPGEPGKPGESTPLPPAPLPPDELEDTTTCSLKWELSGLPPGRYYEISYQVFHSKANETLVTLQTTYRTPKGSAASDKTEAKYPQDDARAASAYISSLQWEVTLAGKKATIKRIPSNETKEITCK